MNEIIDHIAYHAGMYCDGTPDSWDSETIEKFAQGIIRECFETILDHKGETSHRGFAFAILNQFEMEE